SGVSFTDNGNGSATLSGTPAQGTVGSYPITVTANNGVGTNATQSFTLTVSKGTVGFNSLTSSQSISYGTASLSLSGRITGPQMIVGSVTVTVYGSPPVTDSHISGNQNNFGVTVNTSGIAAGTYTIAYSYSGN